MCLNLLDIGDWYSVINDSNDAELYSVRKPSTIYVRLDFLKCVHIFISSKRESVQKLCLDFLVTVKICVTVEKIYTRFLFRFAF